MYVYSFLFTFLMPKFFYFLDDAAVFELDALTLDAFLETFELAPPPSPPGFDAFLETFELAPPSSSPVLDDFAELFIDAFELALADIFLLPAFDDAAATSS